MLSEFIYYILLISYHLYLFYLLYLLLFACLKMGKCEDGNVFKSNIYIFNRKLEVLKHERQIYLYVRNNVRLQLLKLANIIIEICQQYKKI